jgi:long-chain acyl-CoA synthetase
MSLLWSVIKHALRSPRKVAAVDDRRSYTYAEVVGGAMFLADAIETRTQNANVGIMLPTSGAFPVALLGIWMAKRVAVPLNYLLAPDELAYVIADSGIDCIIIAEPMLEFLGGADKIPDGIDLLKLESISFKGLPPLRWPPMCPSDDLAAILYTSGTSGRPKGVMLTHGNLASNVNSGVIHSDMHKADTFLGILPQFHSFGLTVLTLMPLRVGAKAVYSARFVPRKVVDLIREHRPDIFLAIPSMYGALLTVRKATPDDYASIRMAITGGEPLPQATFDTFNDKLHLRLLEGYGLTETSPGVSWCTPRHFKRYSVGQPVAGVSLLIVDEHDQPLPAGAEGEILIAGPNIMAGYYNLPELTDQVIVHLADPANGKLKRFFRSGDLGHVDREGYLFITGRKKEMLIIAGENVTPREIEEVLMRDESVQAVAVVGLVDPMRGEVPIAFVELNEGCTLDEARLRSICREHLAGYKVPRQIRQIEQMPRNPTGKVLRRKLKELL